MERHGARTQTGGGAEWEVKWGPGENYAARHIPTTAVTTACSAGWMGASYGRKSRLCLAKLQAVVQLCSAPCRTCSLLCWISSIGKVPCHNPVIASCMHVQPQPSSKLTCLLMQKS